MKKNNTDADHSLISNKLVIVVAGPTAVGKTAHAIDLAKHFNTVIISADSRQCFKELDIGVARPSTEELVQVPHYFIASHSIHDPVNSAWYESYVTETLQELFVKHDVVVVTGGTGLYIKALVEGLDLIPDVDESIRQEIVNTYREEGIGWLQQQLQARDPLFATKGEMLNPQRMMRALEVVWSTGQSIISFRNREPKPRPFNVLQIGLELPRPVLYDRINLRVDKMMDAGLEQEVRSVLPFRHLNALQTVGYKELFDYFDGEITLSEAIALIKQNTRHYAKRQMTWFKKQPNLHWVDIEKNSSIIPVVDQLIKNA